MLKSIPVTVVISARWLSRIPLGAPVVPVEKITTASSSGPIGTVSNGICACPTSASRQMTAPDSGSCASSCVRMTKFCPRHSASTSAAMVGSAISAFARVSSSATVSSAAEARKLIRVAVAPSAAIATKAMIHSGRLCMAIAIRSPLPRPASPKYPFSAAARANSCAYVSVPVVPVRQSASPCVMAAANISAIALGPCLNTRQGRPSTSSSISSNGPPTTVNGLSARLHGEEPEDSAWGIETFSLIV